MSDDHDHEDGCEIELHQHSMVSDLMGLLDRRLLDDRVVFITDDINHYQSARVARMIHFLAETEGDIIIRIASPGGFIDAGYTIIRAIRYAQEKRCTVIGEVWGFAMSMAFFILQTCDVRTAHTEDVVMAHGVTAINVGDIRNQEADLELSKHYMSLQAQHIAERNTSDDPQYHDPEYWRKMLDDNFPVYLFGEEAFKRGLLDEVI